MAKWWNKKIFSILLVITVLILVSIYIIPITIPLILGLITAVFLEPFVGFFRKRFKWQRKPAVITTFLLFMVLVSGLLYWTVTYLVGRLILFSQNLPDYINSLSSIWEEIQAFFLRSSEGMPREVIDSFETELERFMEGSRDWLLTIVNYDTITNLLTGIPAFLVSFLVFLIALFLFMLDLDNLKRMLFDRLKESTAEKVRFMAARLNHVIFGFLKAQFLVSVIIFLVSFVALLFIAPELAIVMSLLIWLIDFIPILGSIIVLTPWFIYEFITGDIARGTQLVVLALVLLIIRRTVEPKVMGSHIGLSPLATLIAMFIGLQLIGVLGFFVGPLIVILFTSAREAGMIKLDFKV